MFREDIICTVENRPVRYNHTETYQTDKPEDIFVVDDTPENLMFLESILAKEGYRVRSTSCGKTALKTIKNEIPDLVLLDIMMPEMDGYEVCHHLKSEPQTRDIPIIFISSLDRSEDKIKGFRNGAVDYITKPFNYEDVLIRVETHLTQRFLQKELQKKNILLMTEIRERKRAEKELEKANKVLRKIASLDGLTNIANRRQFDKILWHEWRRLARQKKPLSLILCDIDFFKNYNDTYGHVEGDECLKKVAQCISRTVHRPADLTARYGGEEFIVILPYTDIEGAEKIAEDIRQAVGDLQIVHARSEAGPHVSVSIGVSCAVPIHRKLPEQLITDTDAALYRAKMSGRDRIVCNV